MTKLWLPGLHGEEPSMVCTVPTGEDQVCGKLFYPGEERAWQRHVGECAREHMDQVQASRPSVRLPAVYESLDPEVDAHMERVGKQMLKEGRLTVHPHERAGFS